MAKLELAYQAIAVQLPLEVDEFYASIQKERSERERCIDIDNLQGIVIYLVWSLKDPKLITDCFLINEFASAIAIQSKRMGYLNYLKASIDFLLELDFAIVNSESPNVIVSRESLTQLKNNIMERSMKQQKSSASIQQDSKSSSNSGNEQNEQLTHNQPEPESPVNRATSKSHVVP